MKTKVSYLAAAVAAILGASAAHAQTPACSRATSLRIPCTVGQSADTNYLTQTAVAVTLPTGMPWQGNTAATIDAQYPAMMDWIFQMETRAMLVNQLWAMSDLDLARFAQSYWASSKGQIDTIMYHAAVKLDAESLVRWSSAWGKTETDNAVRLYATPRIAAQYFAMGPPARIIPQSHAMHMLRNEKAFTMGGGPAPFGSPTPTIDMTMREIYNEYLWTGSSPSEAVAKALYFVANKTVLGRDWIWAYAIGKGFYYFADKISPGYGADLTVAYGQIQANDFGGLPNVGVSITVGDPIDPSLGVNVDTWKMNDVSP